jgi:hypothetical protein
MLQQHIKTIHDDFIRRLEESLNAERAVREKEVDAERTARKKEVDAEQAAREKLKKEVDAERTAREKLAAQFFAHVKESKSKMEQKDKLLFEEKQKLVREHEADLKREQQRADDKYNDVLRHLQDRDEYLQTISDNLTDTINATTDFVTLGVCVSLHFTEVS